MTSLTADEKTACEHIARLFLGAQNTEEELAAIADALAPLDLSTEQLEHILRHDLFGILFTNPFSFEGAWVCFDTAQLWREVEEQRRRTPGWARAAWDRLMWATVGWAFWGEWSVVKEGVEKRRMEKERRDGAGESR